MTTDKYKAACIEYRNCKSAVDALSKQIAEALSDCTTKQEIEWRKLHYPGKQLWEIREHFTPTEHLKNAYEIVYDDDGVGLHTNGDPAKYLTGICPHCLKAHELIQARKEARKRFGIAKRRITNLGLNAKKGGV